LAAKPHPGPAPKLSDAQRDELIEIVLTGPTTAGYRTDLWTCSRIAAVIRKRFKVQYNAGHLSRILHALGFSPQKPRQVAREQDPAAVERWRSWDWPRVKKKPLAAVHPSPSSMKLAAACSQ
jgi:transposase